MKYVALGVIGRPFGIRGELRFKPYNSRTTWFDSAKSVCIQIGDKEPVHYPLLKHRWHKDLIVLTLKGELDRDGAEKLRGAKILVPEDDLEKPEEDEYYWYELVGLDVYLEDGRKIGEIIRMEETAPKLGGHDVIVVFTQTGELFVPATAEVVLDVDIKNKKMVVRAISGLTEIKE